MTIKVEKHISKQLSMLLTFVDVGEYGINCFESVNIHHDYVLRTTVSEITARYGIEFVKQWERVRNFKGKLTKCLRYSLDSPNRELAIAIIERTLGHGGTHGLR